MIDKLAIPQTIEVVCPCRCKPGTLHGGCLTCGWWHDEHGDVIHVAGPEPKRTPPRIVNEIRTIVVAW